MKKLILMLYLVLFLQGCATQQFPINENKVPTIPTYEGITHFVFWGIGQTRQINPQEVCGKKEVAAVETNTSFVHGLISMFTYGIYSPRNYAIYCKQEY